MTLHKPYKGTTRKLAIAFDVGTTYSGISYAILDPGEIPRILGVTRYPGQENAAGDTKIPSILYYRPDGIVYAAGAEAALPNIELVAEDNNLVYVEWFKLHLRPDSLDSASINKRTIPALPFGKTATDVFADFLRYLLHCAKKFITETHPNGESLWTSVENQIEYTLSHPNGWEGFQQGKMRSAAVQAGLIPHTPSGHSRLHFVTEGEASLQYCLKSGLTLDTVQPGQSVMVVDAGGGTVDISSYSFITTSPLSAEETAPPDCILHGSTQVNVRAKSFIGAKLKDSRYGTEEDVKSMLDSFDKSTKPIFKDASETSYIKFGPMSCSDASVGIRRGTLMLSGAEMLSFFEPSLNAIIEAIKGQCKASRSRISTVFLVGGFAANSWLFDGLQQAVGSMGLQLARPDSHTNKAVAEGAVSFYIEQFVGVRVAKSTYGMKIHLPYNRRNPVHYARRNTKFTDLDGIDRIPDAFSMILAKGTRVPEDNEIRMGYRQLAEDPRSLNRIYADIRCYKGQESSPQWTDLEPEMFVKLCTIFADTSSVVRQQHVGRAGKIYYKQLFDVVLLCGKTELQAQISWTENGVEKRGPAKIVFDEPPRAA